MPVQYLQQHSRGRRRSAPTTSGTQKQTGPVDAPGTLQARSGRVALYIWPLGTEQLLSQCDECGAAGSRERRSQRTGDELTAHRRRTVRCAIRL